MRKKERPLNDEQRALVEKNYKLVFQYMKDKNLMPDQWQCICEIGLCKAARDWQPDKGAFSTVAYNYMYHEYLNELSATHKERMNQQNICVHLQDRAFTAFAGESDKPDTVEDTIGQAADFTAIQAHDFVTALTPKEKVVLKGKVYGYSSATISAALGRGRGMIYKHNNTMKAKAMAIFG